MLAKQAIVMKFGGTSVEDERAFARVARIVAAHRDAPPVVVVSAMSRVTDALLASVETAAAGDAGLALQSLEEHFEPTRSLPTPYRQGERWLAGAATFEDLTLWFRGLVVQFAISAKLTCETKKR